MNPHRQASASQAPEPSRHRRIVRDGEALVLGPIAGTPGEGVAPDGEGWCASLAGVGYLEFGADGIPHVAPVVVVEPDRVNASIDLRSAVEGEAELTKEEVAAALVASGVTHGLCENRIEAAWRMFHARGSLLRPMRVATGEPPVLGQLARIEYEPEFDSEKKAHIIEAKEGRAAEDGSIDFHEQGSVINVPEGALIGIWIPGQESTPGVAIDGEVIAVPASQKSKALRTGKNVSCEEQEDGSVRLTADISGVLEIDKGAPSVSEVLTIKGDVDFETGNIDADGSVVITGAVRSGFRVCARLDLTVGGIVEGSDLVSGGDMELKKGLIGSDETSVIVGGSLRLKYAQNANIECRGDVELLDADMGSTILCAGKIIAIGGRGRLRGGVYSAAQGVRAKEIGSDLGAVTIVAVGADELLERERTQIKDKLDALKVELRKLKRKPSKGAGSAERKAAKARRVAEKKQQKLRQALLDLGEAKTEEVAPEIVAKKGVFFGSELTIRGVTLRPTETTGGRRFELDPVTTRIQTKPV